MSKVDFTILLSSILIIGLIFITKSMDLGEWIYGYLLQGDYNHEMVLDASLNFKLIGVIAVFLSGYFLLSINKKF